MNCFFYASNVAPGATNKQDSHDRLKLDLLKLYFSSHDFTNLSGIIAGIQLYI